MNLHLLSRLVHPTRCAAAMALALGIAAPAVSQWKTNPIVEEQWVYYGPSSTVDRCRLELAGCALVIRAADGDIAIERTDTKGNSVAARYFSDPSYPFVNNGGKYLVNDYYSVVGCKVGPLDFMLAYAIQQNGGPFGSVLRVVRLHWNSQTDQYTTVSGFPVTISNAHATDTAITPNETTSGIDGAMVAWQVSSTTPAQVTIYQQGVDGIGGRVWSAASYANGVAVDNYLGSISSLTQPPSIVSTGDGLAVVTYHKGVPGSMKHWTVKLDSAATPVFGPQAVPGQGTHSPSRCSVASAGDGGAMYGFATDGNSPNTELVVAREPGASPAPNSFWDSSSNGGGGGINGNLRALTFLAMPGQTALLVYRDLTGIRCIKWSAALGFLWTRFVRGASLLPQNHDDAAAAFHAGAACVATTSDADVLAKAFGENGDEFWETHVNDPTTTMPYKSVTAFLPKRPHVWATGGTNNPGFMLGWWETNGSFEVDNEWPEDYLAERLYSKTGKPGNYFYTGYPGAGFDLGSAVLFDMQCVDPLRMQIFQFELAESSGAGGMVEVYTAVGTSYAGIANNAAAWTLAGSGNIVSAGPGQLSSVTLSSPVVLPAGTNAVAIRGVGVSLGSTAAVGGNQTFDVGGLTIQCGAHVANWPSGAVQTGRVFQGSLAYEDAGIPVTTAAHIAYGAGCYAVTDSFYSYFADAGAAATALTGQSMTLIPVGSQYFVSWGGGSFVAPSGGAVGITGFAPNGDDGVATYTIASGALSGLTLFVHSNGNIWFGDNRAALLPNDYTPRASGMLAAPHTGFWSWHDYNLDEPGSGQVFVEESGNVLYVTWLNVESYPLGVANPSTFQFQVDLGSGSVTCVWQHIDGDSTSSFGSSHLVGYSPGGASVDGGSLALSTALPLLTTVGMQPLTLTASPAPVAGTTVNYTIAHMPEASPGSGVYVGVLILSLGSSPGIDLGFLGAPGCLLHVASLDLMLSTVGFSPIQTVSFPLPAVIPSGVSLFAQAAALVVPGSLPNGQNAFGLVTSNGLLSRFGN
ncbi:MAG TPA: hypothetical protein VFZ65_23145 [Planctomycetota bacterium]|nr:hypothetical protein [Planctomycetota bacterium]